jgi:XTP/dITP diphosphohydrolase
MRPKPNNAKPLEIAFVTSNEIKFQQISNIIKEISPFIKLNLIKLDLPEYQSLDIDFVSLEKAKVAWSKVNQPLIVDDGGIYLNQYNNFPGPLAKYVFAGLSFEGFFKLISQDNKGNFTANIVYTFNGIDYKIFKGILKGHFHKPLDLSNLNTKNKMPYTEIFIPENHTKTLDVILKENPNFKLNHRFIAIKNFIDYLTKNMIFT